MKILVSIKITYDFRREAEFHNFTKGNRRRVYVYVCVCVCVYVGIREGASSRQKQYIIREVKNVPVLSNSPYFSARDKSITGWYIAARVYTDIKIV